MLRDVKFEVLEIRENGVTIKHYLQGKRKDVQKDIDMIKKESKNYEIVGKNGMVVWV